MARRSKIKLLKDPVPVYDREKASHGVLRRTTFIMIFCGVLLFIPLIWQLFQLMIVQHDKYESKAISNQTRSTSVAADRGRLDVCVWTEVIIAGLSGRPCAGPPGWRRAPQAGKGRKGQRRLA